MEDLLNIVAKRATRYHQNLSARSVAPHPAAVEELAQLDVALPEHPTDPAMVVEILDRIGSPATVASAGGRYFGFVVGGSLPAALAANWLAGAWDQNALCSATSPVAARLEEISLRWLLELFHLPAGCASSFVTGATMANLTALAAARHAVLSRLGWDVESQGLFGAPPVPVIVGAEAHPTLLKAIGLLGLGHERVLRIPVDDQGKMRADALPKISGPAIVCLQAGNVNSGAFDPAEEICAQAHAAGAWVHVDGAFGLWAAAAPERAHLTAGFAAADSWATDAHKWLNVPYDSGLAFIRDREALRAAMSPPMTSFPQGDSREPWQYSPEASRRARGIEIWAALVSLGRSGVADLVERTCRYASQFAEGLRAAGCQILNEVVLNQVLVSFGSDEKTERVIAAVQKDGTCWCGGTVWHGCAAMRISVCSWATTEEDVQRSLAAILRVAAE